MGTLTLHVAGAGPGRGDRIDIRNRRVFARCGSFYVMLNRRVPVCGTTARSRKYSGASPRPSRNTIQAMVEAVGRCKGKTSRREGPTTVRFDEEIEAILLRAWLKSRSSVTQRGRAEG
jgi:hypothetical protein